MIRKLFITLLLLVVLAAGAVAYGFWKLESSVQQTLSIEQSQLLEVAAGATPSGLFNRLESEHIIKDAFWLRLYWRLYLPEQRLQRGEYRLQPGMSVAQLLELWQQGEVEQYSLTLVEGWTFRQLRNELARHEKLEHTLEGLSDADVMVLLDAKGEYPEGRFFPDTYRYVKGMRDIDLLRQSYKKMQQVLELEWAGREAGLPYKDAYQALIMASLIERETGVPSERPEIAGVFVRRMGIGMRLQTDPTVIYGMGDTYKGRITRADLRAPSAYNTYVIDGLPPTPIAMPGREAINAALHPLPGKSLYFVARGDGSHVFSNNLEAHNRAVREYQLKRRSDYRSSPAPSTR